MDYGILRGVLFFGPYLAIFFSSIILTGVWIFRDARARGSDQPLLWATNSVVLHPFAPLYYLYRRHRGAGLNRRSKSPTKYDRFLSMWVTAAYLAHLGGLILSQPDIGVAVVNTYLYLVVLLPVMYLLIYREIFWTVLERISLS